MLEHDRSHCPLRGPTDQCQHRLTEERAEAKAANGRVAFPCPPATSQICSPRMSIGIPKDVVPSERQSTLGEATAGMLHDWLVARERSCLTIELGKYPAGSVPRCNRPPTRLAHQP